MGNHGSAPCVQLGTQTAEPWLGRAIAASQGSNALMSLQGSQWVLVCPHPLPATSGVWSNLQALWSRSGQCSPLLLQVMDPHGDGLPAPLTGWATQCCRSQNLPVFNSQFRFHLQYLSKALEASASCVFT